MVEVWSLLESWYQLPKKGRVALDLDVLGVARMDRVELKCVEPDRKSKGEGRSLGYIDTEE